MTIRQKVLYGVPTAKVSAEIAASALIYTGSGIFYGLSIKCDGTNDLTVNVFDSLTATGTKLIPENTIIDGTVKANAIGLDPGVRFSTGLYIEITCAGTVAIQPLYLDDAIKPGKALTP